MASLLLQTEPIVSSEITCVTDFKPTAALQCFNKSPQTNSRQSQLHLSSICTEKNGSRLV